VALFRQSPGDDESLVVETRPAKAADAKHGPPATAQMGAVPSARPKLAVEAERAGSPQPGSQQANAPQPASPQQVAAAGSSKGHPFEPEEEGAIIANAYAGAKELVADEPEQPLAKQINARMSGGGDAIATQPVAAHAVATKPSPAKPAASAPAPSPKPAANTAVSKTFVATPAPPANKPKAGAPHPQKPKKSPEDDPDYDFGI